MSKTFPISSWQILRRKLRGRAKTPTALAGPASSRTIDQNRWQWRKTALIWRRRCPNSTSMTHFQTRTAYLIFGKAISQEPIRRRNFWVQEEAIGEHRKLQCLQLRNFNTKRNGEEGLSCDHSKLSISSPTFGSPSPAMTSIKRKVWRSRKYRMKIGNTVRTSSSEGSSRRASHWWSSGSTTIGSWMWRPRRCSSPWSKRSRTWLRCFSSLAMNSFNSCNRTPICSVPWRASRCDDMNQWRRTSDSSKVISWYIHHTWMPSCWRSSPVSSTPSASSCGPISWNTASKWY